MPFTPIGSLGDIVALSLVVRDLIKALDETRGSSAQYQELIWKLWAFNRVIQQVQTVCRKCEDTVEMNALVVSICCTANQSRQCIEAFLTNIETYGPSLSKGGSANTARDVLKKAQWRVCRSDELTKLQTEIDVYCSILSVLISTANIHMTEIKAEKLHARLESSEEKSAAKMKEQRLILDEIKTQLDESDKQIRAGNAMTSKIIESLGLDWIRSLSRDMKKFMQAIFMATFATYHAVKDIQGGLPSNLERCLYQEPFVLEDSHGRIKPVYLDCINSWDAFDAWIEVQFRGLKGHMKVQRNQYVLHDLSANTDITQRCPWETAFLPGHRVVMCMLFLEEIDSSQCPKCFSESTAVKDSETKCARCGLWYRRRSEIDGYKALKVRRQFSNDDNHRRSRTDEDKALKFESQFLNDDKPNDASGLAVVTFEKRNLDPEEEETVASFKRVRMVSLPSLFGSALDKVSDRYRYPEIFELLVENYKKTSPVFQSLRKNLSSQPIHPPK